MTDSELGLGQQATRVRVSGHRTGSDLYQSAKS